VDLIPRAENKTKVFKLGLTLTPAQKAIDSSTARFKIVRAGRKFGKTTLSQKKALDWLKTPGSVHWHIAPTYRQAKLISWEEFKRMIPQEALGKKPNDADLMIVLKNGSRLHLMGSDDPDALRGPAPTSATFEEAAFQKAEVWHEIMRPNLMPKKAPVLFIGTPKGFNWFYDLEEEAKRSIARGENEWATFHYSVYDNPHIEREEIEKARKSCGDPRAWNQEYLALYESSVGRVFAMLDPERHSASLPIPSGPVHRAVDWGMRDNTAALWGQVKTIDGKKKLCIYREYLENNLSASRQAEVIKRMTTAEEHVVCTAISHDAAKQDAEIKGLTVQWHFQNAGIAPLRKSSRDKEGSRELINALIQEDRLLIDKSRCPKLWKQMMIYEWKDTTMAKPEDTPDDAVDALHYLVELLQFELFAGGKIEKKLTTAEIIAEHEKKVASMSHFPIHRSSDALPLSGGSAGYVH
jgi:hypothetical protein